MKKGLLLNLQLCQIPVTAVGAMPEMVCDGIYPWFDTFITTNFCSVKQCLLQSFSLVPHVKRMDKVI